jgi:putative nucleotidyltransferase with HDIG domain
MKDCSLPTRKECFEILKEYHVPPHIVRHSLTVAKLAVFLAQRLNEKAVAVDVDLVDRACLLHDIARVFDFKQPDYDRFERSLPEKEKARFRQLRAKYKDTPHEYAAYDILKEKYPKLALTIKKHRYMGMLDETEKPHTWEERLVYYADMRVMHEAIAPLKKRLAEGHKRNVHFYDSVAHSKIEKIELNPLEVTDDFIDSY